MNISNEFRSLSVTVNQLVLVLHRTILVPFILVFQSKKSKPSKFTMHSDKHKLTTATAKSKSKQRFEREFHLSRQQQIQNKYLYVKLRRCFGKSFTRDKMTNIRLAGSGRLRGISSVSVNFVPREFRRRNFKSHKFQSGSSIKFSRELSDTEKSEENKSSVKVKLNCREKDICVVINGPPRYPDQQNLVRQVEKLNVLDKHSTTSLPANLNYGFMRSSTSSKLSNRISHRFSNPLKSLFSICSQINLYESNESLCSFRDLPINASYRKFSQPTNDFCVVISDISPMDSSYNNSTDDGLDQELDTKIDEKRHELDKKNVENCQELDTKNDEKRQELDTKYEKRQELDTKYDEKRQELDSKYDEKRQELDVLMMSQMLKKNDVANEAQNYPTSTLAKLDIFHEQDKADINVGIKFQTNDESCRSFRTCGVSCITHREIFSKYY